eukprot:s4217_g1.t1
MGTLATLGILGFGELFVWSVCKAVTKVSAHFFKNPLHYFPVCFPGCSLNRDSFRGQGGNPPAGGSHGGCSCRNLVKVSSVSMSSWLKRCRAFLEKDGRWFTSQKPLPAVRWQSALQQMNAEWAQDIRRKQLHVATNPMLNATIVVLLITNTIFLGFEVDDKRSAAAGGNWFFVMMELSFAAVFIGEFFIRFHHQRWEFFADNWNVFDYTLVLMGFNDSMMTLLTPLAGTQLARAFRVFRGLRVARNVRTVKKLSGLWFIIGGLLETVKTMMLVAAIASILIFALGVALTTVIGSQPFILELWRQASIYMGSVARSMLTILQVATLDGWTQSVARPLWELSPFGFFTLILSVVVQLGQA